VNGGDWRPTADACVIRHRAAMLARARTWFASQQVLEVQTPLLSSAAVSDPAIESLAVVAGSGRRQFLQTSPEYPMKRLLAAGIGDCYQICPVFRDGESGRLHSPEFTMIEWYRLGFGVEALQRDVAGLLQATTAGLRQFAPARSLTYREAIRQSCGLDIRSATVDDIAATLAANGIRPVATPDWDIDVWLDLLVGAVVGPGLGFEAPVFVRDYPASQAALARLRADDDGTPVAERFELYVDGIELANGFHELGDADEQRCRFERDLDERRVRKQPLNPLDERLLAALALGLPGCSGVALGFDRLVLVALVLPDLASELSFTDDRA
jgi:lysyl-tRNA synthetase class 2